MFFLVRLVSVWQVCAGEGWFLVQLRTGLSTVLLEPEYRPGWGGEIWGGTIHHLSAPTPSNNCEKRETDQESYPVFNGKYR